ncbi:unnamed protein product [Prorocentrum cordatum]|uniref:Uncharacterized protein n=1 Tax=Prorocentrum cordatum TaxID=2364126 RepID=A0ABN9PRP2_9DINO|nr:unnamed protein product [Polarella glacialis]
MQGGPAASMGQQISDLSAATQTSFAGQFSILTDAVNKRREADSAAYCRDACPAGTEHPAHFASFKGQVMTAVMLNTVTQRALSKTWGPITGLFANSPHYVPGSKPIINGYKGSVHWTNGTDAWPLVSFNEVNHAPGTFDVDQSTCEYFQVDAKKLEAIMTDVSQRALYIKEKTTVTLIGIPLWVAKHVKSEAKQTIAIPRLAGSQARRRIELAGAATKAEKTACVLELASADRSVGMLTAGRRGDVGTDEAVDEYVSGCEDSSQEDEALGDEPAAESPDAERLDGEIAEGEIAELVAGAGLEEDDEEADLKDDSWRQYLQDADDGESEEDQGTGLADEDSGEDSDAELGADHASRHKTDMEALLRQQHARNKLGQAPGSAQEEAAQEAPGAAGEDPGALEGWELARGKATRRAR